MKEENLKNEMLVGASMTLFETPIGVGVTFLWNACPIRRPPTAPKNLEQVFRYDKMSSAYRVWQIMKRTFSLSVDEIASLHPCSGLPAPESESFLGGGEKRVNHRRLWRVPAMFLNGFCNKLNQVDRWSFPLSVATWGGPSFLPIHTGWAPVSKFWLRLGNSCWLRDP